MQKLATEVEACKGGRTNKMQYGTGNPLTVCADGQAGVTDQGLTRVAYRSFSEKQIGCKEMTVLFH